MREKLIELTKELVKIRTETLNYEEVLRAHEFIKKFILSKVNCKIKVFEKNNVKSYFYYYENKGLEVCLCGHIDVVPASLEEYNSWNDEIYIYGRGSGDMKSGLSAIIYAFINNPTKNISLLITGDEEIGGVNGAGLAKDYINSDIVIITEYSDNKLVLTEKAGLWVDLVVEGPGGHASRPWLNHNCIDILIKIIGSIRRKYPEVKKEGWVTTLNVGCIIGGDIINNDLGPANKIAQNAKCRLDFRLTETISHELVLKHIQSIIAKYKKRLGPNYRVYFEEKTRLDLMHIDKDLPYAKLFLDCMEEEGLPRSTINMHGASDGRFFSAKGIPVLMLGPKSIGQHSTNEKVEIKSVVRTYNIINRFLEKVS